MYTLVYFIIVLNVPKAWFLIFCVGNLVKCFLKPTQLPILFVNIKKLLQNSEGCSGEMSTAPWRSLGSFLPGVRINIFHNKIISIRTYASFWQTVLLTFKKISTNALHGQKFQYSCNIRLHLWDGSSSMCDACSITCSYPWHGMPRFNICFTSLYSKIYVMCVSQAKWDVFPWLCIVYA